MFYKTRTHDILRHYCEFYDKLRVMLRSLLDEEIIRIAKRIINGLKFSQPSHDKTCVRHPLTYGQFFTSCYEFTKKWAELKS